VSAPADPEDPRRAPAGPPPGTPGTPASSVAKVREDRIWTIPNALSVLRLFGVPLFLWLLLGPHADGWALVVLAVSGFTDWLDGVLARKLNQTSELGALLDPLADRLYILATLVGLVLRHVIPLWLAIVLVARDVVLGLVLPFLRRAGYGPPAVHYLGKAATFCLLYAFPLLLLGTYHGVAADIARPLAWGFTIWGTALYLWSGVVYLHQSAGLLRDPARPARAGAL
jgi:cardiolipin synthase